MTQIASNLCIALYITVI